MKTLEKHHVGIDFTDMESLGFWGTLWIHKRWLEDDGKTRVFDIKLTTLTQYQRAVRLLNMFVERGMK